VPCDTKVSKGLVVIVPELTKASSGLTLFVVFCAVLSRAKSACSALAISKALAIFFCF